MTNTGIYIAYACHICKADGFTRKQSARWHYQNVEGMEWTIDSSEKAALPPGTAIVEKEVTERIVYGCPCCTSVYDTLNVLGEHIEAHLRKNGSSPTSSSFVTSLDQESASLQQQPLPGILTTDNELIQEVAIVDTDLSSQTDHQHGFKSYFAP